jgi:chromate transport protein ChrA
VLSGFSILLLTLGAIPLFKLIKRSLRSPSAHTLWFIIFVIFFCAERIADEMTVISFVGFIGNLLGALCFRIGRARRGASESDEG